MRLRVKKNMSNRTSSQYRCKRKSRLNSPVWNYFKRLNSAVAKCHLCYKVLSYKTSITNLKQHLLLQHKLDAAKNNDPLPTNYYNVPLEMPPREEADMGQPIFFETNNITVKDEPIDESYSRDDIEVTREEFCSEVSNEMMDNCKKEIVDTLLNETVLQRSKATKLGSPKPPQYDIQFNNADKDILFVLSLSEDMKRVPKETKTQFKGELMIILSRLLHKYQHTVTE